MKLLLIIITVCFAIQTYSQSKFKLNEHVNIDLPPNTLKIDQAALSRQTISAHWETAGETRGTHFKTGAFYMYFFDMPQIKISPAYLSEQKKFVDALGKPEQIGTSNPKSNLGYHSEIREFPGKKVLITNINQFDDTKLYEFYCVDDQYRYLVCGHIRYEKSEFTQATELLNQILQNIIFK